MGDYKAFAKGYDKTASVRVKIGKVRSDGAAGSIYATVPVAVEAVGTDGSRRVFSGCYRTRFIEPDIQEPPFRPLFIETGHLARSARTFSEAVPSACTDDAQPIFATGGDGAMVDIGFQNLSRLMASGKPIRVMVLDTQVYSNTGGQACTTGFLGQVSDMAAYGKAQHGKEETRKALVAMVKKAKAASSF